MCIRDRFLPGAKIGVLGPNGAGKSTVLQIMAGIQQPSNGEGYLSCATKVVSPIPTDWQTLFNDFKDHCQRGPAL